MSPFGRSCGSALLVLLLGMGVAVSTERVGASPARLRAAAVGQVEAPKFRLQVWNLNTHGMERETTAAPSKTNYLQFIDFITDPSRNPYLPDVVTLQEAGTNIPGTHLDSCQVFVLDLEQAVARTHTPVDYNCLQTTKRGGAAIVYQTRRMSYVGGTSRTVQESRRQTVTDSCHYDLSTTEWYALVLQLKDDLAGKRVNVASLHLPLAPTGSDASVGNCTWADVQVINSFLSGAATTVHGMPFPPLGSASMQIMAGDWNHVDATASPTAQFQFWECHYSGTNLGLAGCGAGLTNLGWKDAMYRVCLQAGAAATFSCLHTNYWSFDTRTRNEPPRPYPFPRVDFLFAKTLAVQSQITVTYEDALAAAVGRPEHGALRYSDHRGQGAQLIY